MHTWYYWRDYISWQEWFKVRPHKGKTGEILQPWFRLRKLRKFGFQNVFGAGRQKEAYYIHRAHGVRHLSRLITQKEWTWRSSTSMYHEVPGRHGGGNKHVENTGETADKTTRTCVRENNIQRCVVCAIHHKNSPEPLPSTISCVVTRPQSVNAEFQLLTFTQTTMLRELLAISKNSNVEECTRQTKHLLKTKFPWRSISLRQNFHGKAFLLDKISMAKHLS